MMSKAFILVLRTTILIAAIITSTMPSLFIPSDDINTSGVYAADDQPDDVVAGAPVDISGEGDSDELLRRQGPANCAISIDPIVLHGDDPLPSSKIVPTGGSIASAGFFDVSYPAPDGRNEEVAVGDTLVLYLYLRNTTNNSDEEPCLSGGPVTLNISSIRIFKDSTLINANAVGSMIWPNAGLPGTLLAGEDTYGLIPFEVEVTDNQFDVTAEVSYTCSGAAYCSGTFIKPISYPSPDVRTLGGIRYFDVYGRNPIINVVGPRAEVIVTSPSAGEIVAPQSVVRYVIELTSFSQQAVDDIVSITDVQGPNTSIDQCRSDAFTNPQVPFGWHEDPDGNNRVDSSDLTGPNGPAVGALGDQEKLYCVFDVVMDPTIIDNPADSSFTLNGTLLISNGFQTTEIEVTAPPVVILEASVSVSKTIVDPADPLDGIPIGGTVRYRITITNTGQANLDAVSIVDSLVGPIPYTGGTLAPTDTFSVEVPYTVEFDDPTPLVNTVSVLAHPEGAPGNYFVEDTSATSIAIQGSELSVELKVFSVAPAGNPMAGSTLTYRVEYCNNSSGQFTNMQYVTGFPSLFDGTRPSPHYVDAGILDGGFGPGCFETAGTEFTYAVPDITDPNYSDPVFNTIRVRAIDATGAVRYAEFTLVTNLVSSEVEISAYRYNIGDPGTPLTDSDAALRGETIYYHFDVSNKTATNLCGVQIRHYIRNAQGQLINGNPFVIPNNLITWSSGIDGQLNADPGPGHTAFGEISFLVDSSTPDPLHRIFEVYAPQDCSNPLPEPFIDRAGVSTDISDIQVNTVISVFNTQTPSEILEFGYRTPSLQYQFNYSATNVGSPFTIASLQYCIYDENGGCANQNFPASLPEFIGGNTNFTSFETRSDQSDIIGGASGLTGDEPTPLQILVTLEAIDQNSKSVTIRTLYSFPLLTADLLGNLSGPDELVRGDTPVPYIYGFTNGTNGTLQNVKVFNLLETSATPSPGFYEEIGVTGFPAGTYFEVCQTHGTVLNGGAMNGQCNLTYHDGLPSGSFFMQVLVVGERASDGQKLISLVQLEVFEIPHLVLEKLGPGTTTTTSNVDWTINVTNQSQYQHVDFASPSGFQDVVTPDPPPGTFTIPTLADAAWTGLVAQGGGVYRLPSNSTATYTPLTMTAPLPDGFGQTSFTNTVTLTGSTSPVTPDTNFVSRQVSETAQNIVNFQCPIISLGSFIDNPDQFANTDTFITVGETERVAIGYLNLSSSTLTVTSIADEIYTRENGTPLTFANIVWPNPANPGVLGPGEIAYYETIITIRPIDFPNPEPTRQFHWTALVTLANAPTGCDAFETEWFFEMVNPVLIDKQVRSGFDSIIFPGEEVRYQIALQNRSEHAAMQVTALNDNILELDSSPLRMDFENGPSYVPSGRLDALGGNSDSANLTEDGVQDSHIVTPTDPPTLINTATVHFYVINQPGNGPANMEKGPNYPMANIDDATISTANPLELIITPSTFDAAAGSIIDIDVQVTNTSVDFSITNVVITSGDTEFTAGLAAAGYVPPIASLPPANSQTFTLTNPHYQIPTDHSEPTLTICAQATGTLQQAPPIDLEPVMRCATINIQPPDLEVVKEVFEDAACTTQLPDDDMDMIHEATLSARVYYSITISNNSTTQTFDNISITDITNDGGILTTVVQTEFEAANGGSTSLSPGSSVALCIPYQVTSTALGEPVLTNTVTVNATDAGTPLTVEDEVSVDVVDANIRISKTALPIVGFPGSLIEYTITITNRNPDNNYLILDDVWDTLIADRLPGNPSYHDSCVGVNTPPDFSLCNPSITSIPFSDPNWTWPHSTPGVLPPNQPAIYTYTYEIQDTDPDPLINTAGAMAHIYALPNPGDSSVGPWTIVVDNQVPPQPIIAFDETIASVAVTNSQLLVRKTATPTTALVGSTVHYNIGITNIGDRPVSNIRVFDCNPYTTPCNTNLPLTDAGFGGQELTSSIVPLSARTSLPPFTPTAVINTYSLVMPANADLQPGGSCESCDPFINTVYAQGTVVIGGAGQPQPTLPGSDTAIVDLIVPGMRVTKTPAVGSAGIGATVQYTIEVFNTGDQPLRINSVTDIVPGTSTWTPLTTMSLGACTNPSTFAIGPGSPDRLQPEESLCAIVEVVVENQSGGATFTEFINTVQVNATADPGGLDTTIIDSASAEIDVRNLGLTVTKLAYCIASQLDPSCNSRHTITQVDEGKMYEYEITIVNTSTEPLRELRISDPDYNVGAVTQITDFTGVGDGSALFDPGESYTFTYTHVASILDDIGTGGSNAYTNIVTVSAIEENGDLVQPRTASHTIVFVPAQVEVTKVGCIGTDTVPPDFSSCVVATPFAQPGDFIWYQVTITNPSNIAIDTITVTDSLEGVLDNTANSGQAVVWPSVEGTLPGCVAPAYTPPNCPVATFVYRGSNPVTAADGSITNTAVVNGVSGAANITANDSTTVFVTTSDLLVTIVEDNNRTQAQTGTGLTFTVTITNIGTDTINDINVLLPFLNGTNPLVTPFDLTGGQSLIITPAPTYTVTNADTVMDFEVIANGLAVGTLPVSDDDLWSVTRVTPGLTVTKLADRSIARIGETITYTFIVENTGTTSITNLAVSDPMVTFPPNSWPPGLSPSQSATQQVTYTVTGAEGNPISNTVTATGMVAGSPVAAFASVDVSVPNGDLLVENTPNVASANVGDTVSFTYRICNLSTTDDMTNVQLSDEDGALTLPSSTLAANTCFTVVRDITLTDLHVPELFRTATGSGTFPVGDLTQSVTSSVTVVPASAGDLRLEVQPSTAIAQIGSTVDLTFIITNVSTSTPLTITDFVDVMNWYTDFSINPIGEVLNPGEMLVFTGQTLAAGGTGGIPITASTIDPLTGTWTVTAEDAMSTAYSHDDSISIPVVNPGATLSVSVTSVPQNAVPGGTVTYTYRVQNLAATDANNVTLNYLAQPAGSNCLVYTPGPEGLWTPGGVAIAPSGQAIATAVCEVDTGQAGGTTVDHTIEVLDGASVVQDTAVINTPVNVPLGIEIIGSDPAVWRVESSVTITYRIFNTSAATTVTNIVHSISNPTPCEDIQYFDAAVGGNPVTFNGTLDPLAEIFVSCTHDPVEFQPTGQITVDANVEGMAEGSTVVATAQQVFDVVELGLVVQLTGAPDNGAQTSVVDEGERVNFTLLLENTGQTDLILPPATEDPVTSRVYDSNNPTSVLGTLGDLYTYLEAECVWPLAPDDTCQIAFNDTFVTAPDLTFTPLAIHPSLMQVTVDVVLWDALNSIPVMQTSTWDIEVQRPSITITSLTVSPNSPMEGTEVLITAVIQNDGFSTLENVSAVVNLSEIVAYVPQDGIVLTSGHGQSTILNSIPMDIVDTVLVPGEQTTARIAWEVDRVGQFQVQVITTADNTAAGASLTTVQDNAETTFSSIADPNVVTTDPDGNPLDPDALDPTIVKTAEPEAAFPNQDITFTVTITNGSTGDMGNVSFVDAVPDAFTVVSASSTAGATIVSGQLVTATTGQLGPGERVTITIVTTVAPDVDIPSLWINEACANVEGRDPVCGSVEVGIGTDAAILPTTGFGEANEQHNDLQKQLPVPDETSEEPVAQGIPGAAGAIPLLGMGLMMLSVGQSSRQRMIIGGAAIAIVGSMALGLLVLSGGDDEGDADDTSADAPTLTPTLNTPTAQPSPTLERRAGAEATATLPQFDTPQPPEDLPFPPTIRPSPTPYILPTASGPRRLEIPKLNLTRPVPIVELPQVDNTWDVSQLGHNVGWLEHTTWLDPTWGNTVIVGHVQIDDEDPGPFYHLGSLDVGDEIIIWEGDDRFVYQVSETEVVHATAVQVTHPTRDPILTLLTCTNWDFNRGVFADRLIIRAIPIERPTG